MHAERAKDGVDQASLDLGWTPQCHALLAAKKWFSTGGRIVWLVKPHYELKETPRGETSLMADAVTSCREHVADRVRQPQRPRLALP